MSDELGNEDLESHSGASSPNAEKQSREFGELRELLLGGEQKRLTEIERRLDELDISAEELAEVLPEAVALRTTRDKQLARSLAPTLQEAFGESVQRNPQHIATAIFPILGPAIRKAIAETMAGFVNTLNRAIEHSLSLRGLKWRIEAWRTGVPYPQIVIKHALVYRVEQVFLIHGETGLLLCHATAENLEAQDADLISGMLTAIRDFVQDSFGTAEAGDGGLRTFSVGERTVLVEQGPKALLAAVVNGQHPASLLEKLQATLETIHLHFASALDEFDGDSAQFETALPLLQECLETVLTTDRPRTRGAAPKVAWAAVGVVVLLLGVLWIISTVRWNAAVSALRAEPGIVLVEANRGIWGGGRVSGLLDPLAREPSQLLIESRIDTGRVESNWEPYLSFEPRIVASRAKRNYDAPETVRFELVSDTLFAKGAATFDWITQAQSLKVRVPGVSVLDLSEVEGTMPDELSDLSQRIESRRVLFDIGSSALVSQAPQLISEIASLYEQLVAVAEQAGFDVALEAVGRTDSTGSNETNQMLSRERARRVVNALVASGVPRDVLTESGIGTSDPILSDDPDNFATLNRSVTVSATVELRTRSGGSQE